MTYEQDRERVMGLLLGRPRAAVRRSGAAGETWVDAACLFHDDNVASASFQPDTGVYYCHACARTYSMPEVMDNLGVLPHQNGVDKNFKIPIQVNFPRAAAQWQKTAEWTYRFPDGRVSHTVERYDDPIVGKTIRPRKPDGTAGLPPDFWPIYGDQFLGGGDIVIVVEGEKCVDAVNKVDDRLEAQIRAITWQGGGGSARKHATALAERLEAIGPKLIVLWPDADDPGDAAMREMARALKPTGMAYTALNPADLGLTGKQDVADWLLQGKSLAALVNEYRSSSDDPRAGALARKLIVLDNDRFIYPSTRTAVKIKPEYIQAIWLGEYGVLPRQRQAIQLASILHSRSKQHPTASQSRLYSTDEAFWWRGDASGKAWMVSADGVTTVDDPPDVFLIASAGTQPYPVGVDLDGTQEDFEDLCNYFHLTYVERRVLEVWMICAFVGVQTPIVMFRGPSMNGKTTLARTILGVVEPSGIQMSPSRNLEHGKREIVRTLQLAPALLLDNVSSVSLDFEDFLSQLVTGYATTMRTLYEDSVEMLRMYKALMITTVAWDVIKSELSSRMVVVSPQPHAEVGRWGDTYARKTLNVFIPKVRGWIFDRCVRWYEKREEVLSQTSHFRVGDMGLVLMALGYDDAELARLEAEQKKVTINQYDAWLDAIVKFYGERATLDERVVVTPKELCLYIQRQEGVEEAPAASSPKFHKYLDNKAMIFRDHGFTVEHKRAGGLRMIVFKRVQT